MYNFRKDAKVYIEFDDYLYQIDVYPDLSFSQTFNENSYRKKTLHNQMNLHEGATIVDANPANFNFTFPLRFSRDGYNLPIFDFSYPTTGEVVPMLNIYVQFTNRVYKLENCVFENIVYNISRNELFTTSVSGTAAKLLEDVTLPTIIKTLGSTDPYVLIRCVDVEVDGRPLSSIAALSIEVSDDIEWINNTTINNTLTTGISYREKYVLKGSRISGSITEFVIDESYGQDFNTAGSVVIKLSSELGQNPPFLTFTLPEAVYTRRTNIDELLTRVYDFRLLSNDLQLIPTIRS